MNAFCVKIIGVSLPCLIDFLAFLEEKKKLDFDFDINLRINDDLINEIGDKLTGFSYITACMDVKGLNDVTGITCGRTS